MRPASEALAFRIWQYASAREWDCTVSEIAEALDEPMPRVRVMLGHKGWGGRLRGVALNDCAGGWTQQDLRVWLDNALDSSIRTRPIPEETE